MYWMQLIQIWLDTVDIDEGFGWVWVRSSEAEANEKSWGQDLFFSPSSLPCSLIFALLDSCEAIFNIYPPHDVSPPLSRLWPVIRLIGLQAPPPHSV